MASQDDPVRLRDGSATDSLERLVRNERTPPALSPSQLLRIETKLAAALSGARSPRPFASSRALGLAAMLLIVALGSWWGLRQPPRPALSTPPPDGDRPAATAARVEPNLAPVASGDAIDVRTDDAPTAIVVGRARITVPPRSSVQVRLRPALTVAAYRGEARVEWLDNGHTYVVPAGRTWSERDINPAGKSTHGTKVRVARVSQKEPLLPDPTPEATTSPPPQLVPEPVERGRLGLAEEARILARALQLLRVEHAASRALEELDQHATGFEPGGLGLEADMIRVEALIDLARPGDALAVLQKYPPSQLPPAKARLLRELLSK